jgi:hypothetical protein
MITFSEIFQYRTILFSSTHFSQDRLAAQLDSEAYYESRYKVSICDVLRVDSHLFIISICFVTALEQAFPKTCGLAMNFAPRADTAWLND